VSRIELATPEAALERAAAAARQAAGQAGVEVRVLHTLSEFDAASRLVSRIWADDEPKAPASLLKALSHADNFVAGAWSSGELVGISLGFFGLDDGELYLHSHITGVHPVLQGRAVGFALKQFQRAWALAHGAPTVRWTADPLVRMNTYFNLMKLGAAIVAYHDDFYGRIDDGLNSGEESDRVEVCWELASERVAAAAERTIPAAAVPATGGTVILQADPSGAPSVHSGDGDALLAWIPGDIVRIRESDMQVANAWRRALRDTVGRSLADGYRVEAITRDGWFIITR
jgi:predicted GNAT superfamily acetyltransferase